MFIPDPIDIHVGSRVRMRRTLLGMSQSVIGDKLGLTFQQIQKYERGANRIGSSRLFKLSQILDVPVSFFFDDIPDYAGKRSERFTGGPKHFEANQLTKRETLEMVRAYYRITDDKVRKKTFELVKAIARKPHSS